MKEPNQPLLKKKENKGWWHHKEVKYHKEVEVGSRYLVSTQTDELSSLKTEIMKTWQ